MSRGTGRETPPQGAQRKNGYPDRDPAQGDRSQGCCDPSSQRREARPVGHAERGQEHAAFCCSNRGERRKTAETRAKAEASALQAVQAQAERAVLIPFGAALTARDAVVEATKPYTAGRESAEKELEKVGKRVATNLRKFERRGNTARNRAVREVKKTRTRFERELRQRRSAAVKTVRQNRREAEKQVRSTRREFERQVKATSREVQNQAEGLVSRVEHARLAHSFPPAATERAGPGRDCRPHTSPAVQYLSSLSKRTGAPHGAPVCRCGAGWPRLLEWSVDANP